MGKLREGLLPTGSRLTPHMAIMRASCTLSRLTSHKDLPRASCPHSQFHGSQRPTHGLLRTQSMQLDSSQGLTQDLLSHWSRLMPHMGLPRAPYPHGQAWHLTWAYPVLHTHTVQVDASHGHTKSFLHTRSSLASHMAYRELSAHMVQVDA